MLGSGALAVIFGALTGFGWSSDPTQSSFSYLMAFMVVFSTVIGTLIWLMIGHAANVTWFVPLRRSAEVVIGALPLFILLFVPVLLSISSLYPWSHPQTLSEEARQLVLQKRAMLNVPGFVARALGYLTLLALVGELLRRWSLQQDRGRARALRRRMVALGAGGLPLVAVVLTLASFDWLLGLEPTFYDDMYGVYVFAGGFVSALGLFGLMTVAGRRRVLLPNSISAEHLHAIGRLQLAMIIFWTYIAWAQLMLMWVADLPKEVTWYIARWHGGWQWLGLLLLVVHWLIPFFWLLSRPLKRNPGTFAFMSGWIVVVHWVDVFYLVQPALHPKSFHLDWRDAAATLALASAVVAFAAWRAKSMAPVPTRDPLLAEGLTYEHA